MSKLVKNLRREAGPPETLHSAANPPCAAEADDRVLLTVIVPVYNEATTIDELLRRVVAAPYPKQIIAVDDGSTDGTAARLAAWAAQRHVDVFYHPRNRGKGAAIRTALAHARGEFTIIQDADLEYDPADYPRLIEPLRSGRAQVVYGSRALDDPGAPTRKRHWCLFRLGVKLLNVWARMIYGGRLTDEATCYKAFPTAILQGMRLECERFDFCPEVTAKARRLGLSIIEVPIHYQPRGFPQGKKIRWSDGVQAFVVLWRWRKWCAAGPLAAGRTVGDAGQSNPQAARTHRSGGR
jgi:dolichol-phosphate mannosyltransferase